MREENRDDRTGSRDPRHRDRDRNPDPITGEAGSHPVGTGVGSAGGAAAGAAIGAAFGPIGMLVGGTIGAVAGGAAGHEAGEAIDPTIEEAYWRESHDTRPYAKKGSDYTHYAPAYRYGWESRTKQRGRKWDDSLERELGSQWSSYRGDSSLEWNEARHATRDAWDRADRTYRTYETADTNWQKTHSSNPWADATFDYEGDYRPAYRYGTYSRGRFDNRAWDNDLESDLGRDWERHKGSSRLSWEKARDAAKAGWHSVESRLPGDADRDRR